MSWWGVLKNLGSPRLLQISTIFRILQISTIFRILMNISTVLNMESPFQRIMGKTPRFDLLRVFGRKCYLYLKDYTIDKFRSKSLSCVFLGYSTRHKGYRCLYPRSRHFYISRHALFDGNIFPFVNPVSLHSPHQEKFEVASFKKWVKELQPHAPTFSPLFNEPKDTPPSSIE